MIDRLQIFCGDAREMLKTLPDGCVQTCITSPPYLGLRKYLPNGHEDGDKEIGTEPTPSQYVANLVAVFAEVRRVLKDDGTVWVNLGDSFSGKQLQMIPARVAIALCDDGWYLRQEIVWCLSGGTWIYAQTQKGEMPMMLRDAARLDPKTVKLWNGQKWTQVLGWSRTSRNADELELVLRSGERISCTPTHQFPTDRGLLTAGELQVGDTLQSVRIPEPMVSYAPPAVTLDAAWFIGLYLAEGNKGDHSLLIAGNIKELERLERIRQVAEYYGGSVTFGTNGNGMTIRVYGRLLVALIDQYISGKEATDKCLKVRAWSHSNEWLSSLLQGYLEGDGSYDKGNDRWRLGFCRNYYLERDLRVLAARLGFCLTLNLSTATCQTGTFPAFRGEIRFRRNEHWNSRDRNEIVEIRKARCREVYDVGVEDEPHLFALASGILTHNSKKAPMPESVTDRCTRSHEMVYMLAKQPRYHYDAAAIAEPTFKPLGVRQSSPNEPSRHGLDGVCKAGVNYMGCSGMRNKRSVWTLGPEPYSDAHFACYPTALVKPMVLAGSRPGDVVLDPFAGSGTTAKVALELGRKAITIELNPAYVTLIEQRTNVTPAMF